jgi:hypothetical protein
MLSCVPKLIRYTKSKSQRTWFYLIILAICMAGKLEFPYFLALGAKGVNPVSETKETPLFRIS